MRKVNISCGNVNVLFATNSKQIIELFLHDKENVPETIPGVKVNLIEKETELNEPYILYLDSKERDVKIDEKNNKAIIKFPVEELFFPDLVYLVLAMMSKELNRNNEYFIHCSVVEKNGKGVMIIGEPGSGKTTLSLYLSMHKGFGFVCNDRALLKFIDGVPYVMAGTLVTNIRVGSIPKFFPTLMDKITPEQKQDPWNRKFCLDPEFKDLGIRIKSTTQITHVLFTITYSATAKQTRISPYDLSKRQDVSILKTMECFSQYIRADNNMLISMGFPFPSFDEEELALKRLCDVKKFVSVTEMYSARGDISVLADMIDNLVV